MNYSTSVPIYLQVMDSIKEKIVTGKIPPGEKLPSGRDMALQYTINPNTAARVYQMLEQEQVCFTRRGLGTFVTEDQDRISRLKQEMAEKLVREFLSGIAKLDMSRAEVLEIIRNIINNENDNENDNDKEKGNEKEG